MYLKLNLKNLNNFQNLSQKIGGTEKKSVSKAVCAKIIIEWLLLGTVTSIVEGSMDSHKKLLCFQQKEENVYGKY